MKKTLLTTLGIIILSAHSASAALVAHYSFNGTGQTVTDSSGNGLNGFLGTTAGVETDDPARVTSGLAPVPGGTTGALEFEAGPDPDDGVTIANNAIFSLLESGDTATIALWVNPDANANGQFVSKNGEWSFRLIPGTSGPRMRLDLFGANTGNDPDTEIAIDAWTHVAVTWTAGDGMTGGTQTFYINGEFASSNTINNLSVSTSNVVTLGRQGIGQGFDGEMDDVRIYDHVLSASEIRALAIPEPSTMGLVGLCGIGILLYRRVRTGGPQKGSLSQGASKDS